MKVLIVEKSGSSADISQLVSSVNFSGDISTVARKLDVEVVFNPLDSFLPKVKAELGNMMVFYSDDGVERFRGYIFTKEKGGGSNTLKLTAYDGLIYLTKSKVTYNFKGVEASEIASKVCNNLGVPVGNLIKTSVRVKEVYQSKTAYEVIKSAYKKVTLSTGKQYIPRMNKGKLDITVLGSETVSQVLMPTNSTYNQSLDSMVNKIVVKDGNDNTKDVITDSGLLGYGIIQDEYTIEKGVDYKTAVKALMKGVANTGSVEGLGDYEAIAGRRIQVKEPITGIVGTFLITSDSHTNSGGKHTMSLTLDFEGVTL